MNTVAELEKRLSEPTRGVIEAVGKLKGDLLILGVGGKVGPTLGQMAAKAVAESGVKRKVMGVSAVYDRGVRERLEKLGVQTIKADLLADGALDKLPDAENVIYMCGQKFGSTGAEWFTWGINVMLAGLAARRYRKSRIVAFSSGNIYPFVPLSSGGATEATPTSPIGEYAMSCLGRERMFDYVAQAEKTKILHYRLNYAAELRYGIVYDIGSKVWQGAPIDVTMGNVNVVWQGYANAVALQSLALAASPARILNVAGPELVSVRWMAGRFAELMGKKAKVVGEEAPTALLSNATQCHKLFGYPAVGADTLIEWVAHWIMSGGASLGKPTHYETRDGKF
ncbi:MAG: NAD(P)-dependent oxidoreductase [Candidatus Hydrogenedentes bacterium]|nr:NAD(P)-dependent oxidoreductase [Candidatus Hydrogenedentota bacterium]